MNALSTYSKVNAQTQEALVKNYGLMVKQIAYHLLKHIPNSMPIEDLIQAGMVGLLEAVRHYDEKKGASFETYAGIRIRGHILDEVRRNDWVPRSVHRSARLITKTINQVENRLGRQAKDAEIAAELNLDLNEYHNLVKQATGSQFYGFDDVGLTDDLLTLNDYESTEPHISILVDDMLNQMADAFTCLSEKEALILSLYYEHDLSLKEIGNIIGISESRVCQIHSKVTRSIKSSLV